MVNTAAIVQAKIIRTFADANAFDVATAKTRVELNLDNRYEQIFRSLIRRGILVEAYIGGYYLDYNYYQQHINRRKKLFPIICIILFLFLLQIVISQFFKST